MHHDLIATYGSMILHNTHLVLSHPSKIHLVPMWLGFANGQQLTTYVLCPLFWLCCIFCGATPTINAREEYVIREYHYGLGARQATFSTFDTPTLALEV